MGKALYIAEKPSVAQEFAKALHINGKKGDGFIESDEAVITWCVGHLVTMSYPEVYDIKYKKWSLETLPFLPEQFLYEVIPGVSKQFKTVKYLLERNDVDTIYVCTDSGREGEYIYRLVEQQTNVSGKTRKRVWIDSQTEDEILRGIKEAKALEEYDNLAASAYLRAKEDYLMGINFSRLLTLKYGNAIANYLNERYAVISVGRVMTCVLGMVVRREREIRSFVKQPFYRVLSTIVFQDKPITAEFKAVEASKYYGSPLLYKENGFKERKTAEQFIQELSVPEPIEATITENTSKTEKKAPPLLYNLAELQNDCSRYFKISPDETLKYVQQLYEKKLVTYPRTDARVLSSAVAKEIYKNIKGLDSFAAYSTYANEILQNEAYKGIAKTKYTNDKQITDHYAIIPTGQGAKTYENLHGQEKQIYDYIVKRFLSIFYPAAVYQKFSVSYQIKKESFFANYRVLKEEGYLKLLTTNKKREQENTDPENEQEMKADQSLIAVLKQLKKGMTIPVDRFDIKEGETSPPKRYNSGSMILAMENAGQLIEDEDLRSQIKGSGIGTSATRAEILKKLVNIKYLDLNKKTQILTPTQQGEMIYDVVFASIRSLLNPELTASWEKGLTYVANGDITQQEYMDKLTNFIINRTNGVMGLNNQYQLKQIFDQTAPYYTKVKSSYKKKTGYKKSGKEKENE